MRDTPQDRSTRQRNLWTILAFALGAIVFVVPAIVTMSMLTQRVQSSVESQQKAIEALTKVVEAQETRLQLLERQGDRVIELRDTMKDLRASIEHDRDVQSVRDIALRNELLTWKNSIEAMFLQRQGRGK